MEAFFISMASRAFSVLPLPACHVLGKVFGTLVYWCYPSRRKITRRNISACFPEWSDSEVNRVSRAHFQHMLTGVMTLSIAWWSPARRLDRLVEFQNLDRLDSHLEQGRNIILLVPHFTNLEILGIALFTRYRMATVYKPHRNPRLDALIRERRSRFKGKLHNHTGTQRDMIRDVRNGIPLYYLPDQDSGAWGVFAPFFGIPTATFGSLGRIAEMAHAVVIPCMVRMADSGRRIEVRFDMPMSDFPKGDAIEDATAMNRVIEKLVGDAPEQYFWSHKRFKTRPKGEPPFYF